MEFLFIVFYTAVLGVVAPYVKITSDRYGSLVPPVIGLATGAVIWVVLTWLGFSYVEGWIWTIVMLSMPLAMFFASKALAKKREAQDNLALLATR